ncbi:hypothetical protein [Mycobacterium sp. URHB0021]
MVSVSARSYVAAGLVTAVAGAVVIGPLAAQRQIHLPNVLSANAKLSSAATALSKTEMAVADLAINPVTDVEKAGRQKAPGGSASPAAVSAATAAVSAPDAKTATVHALATVALAVDAGPSSQHVAGAAAVQPNPAASAAGAGASPSALIAVPLLVADIGLDITFALFAIPNNLLSNTGALVFHLVTHQGDFQDDLRAIANVIPHDLGLLASDVSADIRSIGAALGFDANGFGGNAMATLAAGTSTASRVAGAGSLVNVAPKSVEKPGAVHAKPDVKGDTTNVEAPQRHTNEPDTTKGDTKAADTAKANAAKGDTAKSETTKADTGKGDTAKPSAHLASTGSSRSTASSAQHSTVSSAAKGPSTRSGTSARTHRTPGASSHAGGSGAKNGSGAHGGGRHGK